MAKNIRKSRRMIERAGGDSATRARILQVLVNLQVIQGPLAEASKETEAAIQSINKAIQHKSWSLEA